MDTQVANTILEQMGGPRFARMTGAHSFTADNNALIFKLPKSPFNQKHITAVKITLDISDTYTVVFYRIQNKPVVKVEIVAKHEGIYCEDLQTLFTQETGLHTHF